LSSAGSYCTRVKAVAEEGVLHIFGPDGMLVVQHDVTLIPKDVAKSTINETQRREHLKSVAASTEQAPYCIAA
jgi:hypothetical protein